jgi:hypothetical protein
MSKPICEALTTRQSPQADYLEIGVLSADGETFRPVSVVGKGLPRESQLYYVAAEGNCIIRGQDRVGSIAPDVTPQLEPAEPLVAVADVPQPTPEPATDSPISAPDWAVWGLIGVLVVGGAASMWTARRTKATDKTPGENYTVRIEGDDGH